MPGYRSHLGFGFVCGLVGAATLLYFGVFRPPFDQFALLMGLVLLGSLVPDVDTDSKGQNLLYSALAILDLGLLLTKNFRWAAILGFCALFPAIGKHRGWTHTWWAMLLVPAPVLGIPVFLFEKGWETVLPYYLAVVLGYASHLVLDRRFF